MPMACSTPTKPLHRYGIEQQAAIVEDWFRMTRGVPPHRGIGQRGRLSRGDPVPARFSGANQSRALSGAKESLPCFVCFSPPRSSILPTVAVAQAGEPPQRIRNVQLKPGEACPKAASATRWWSARRWRTPIASPTRCATSGPSRRRRTRAGSTAPPTIDQISRVAGGLPDTCSPVGTGGQTGCALQANQAYAADTARALDATTGSGSQPK